MNVNTPEIRARQHLLLQGFTFYTAESAVAIIMQGSATLNDANHAWAVECTPTSWQYTENLVLAGLPDGVWQVLVAVAEQCRDQRVTLIISHTQGGILVTGLETNAVRDVRLKIETAIMLGKAPPAEKLEAFPDELIQREAKRRGFLAARAELPIDPVEEDLNFGQEV